MGSREVATGRRVDGAGIPGADEGRGVVVQVLAADPDLGRGLDDRYFALAQRLLVAPMQRLARGPWDCSALRLGTRCLVLDGLLTRTGVIGTVRRAELLGAGDLISLGDAADDEAAGLATEWRVLEAARLAVLDGDFIAVACRFPPVVSELMDRSRRRATRLAVQSALAEVHGVRTKVLLLLWWLAERWGKVTADGLLLTLPLSHATLGQLVGACRTSVTVALNDLLREEVLGRPIRGALLLKGDPPGRLLSWAPASPL